MKLVPIADMVIEVNKFSFMKMENPNIRPWQYSKGSLYGYKSLHEAVEDIQEGRCLLCGKKPIEHFHHVKPRSKGGADTIDNIAGLCEHCHDKVHKDEKSASKLETKKAGLYKKYHALSVLNQIMPELLAQLSELFGKPVNVTDGRTTAAFRTYFGIEKEHYLDAYCIACSALSQEPACTIANDIVPYELKQYRRHSRQACYKEMLNRNYFMPGVEKKVATNRHKATEQKNDSLAEFRATHSKKAVSKLEVKHQKPVYVDMARVYPGAKFYDTKEKEYFTLQGTVSGQYKDVNKDIHNKHYSKLLKQNTGIVYI